MKSIFLLSSFALFLASAHVFANNDLQKSALTHSNECIQKCNNYYEEHGDLDGFSYYKRFGATVADFFTKNKIPSANKLLYCTAANLALNKCYEQDSAAYNICKWGARGVLSLFTSDPKLMGKLSSCKDACLYDLREACAD